MKYRSIVSEMTFETDWNTTADFEFGDLRGHFEVIWKERDADHMKGAWKLEFITQSEQRIETANIVMKRTGYGRKAAVDFTDFKLFIKRGEKENILEHERVWSFTKASKRLVLWEELPI